MAKYVRANDGTFAGSIGDGKTRVPKAAPKVPLAAKPKETVHLIDAQGQSADIAVGDLNAASRFLTGGNCHSFAAALHAKTSFPIVAFYRDSRIAWEDDEDEDEGDHVHHFAVLSPDGYIIDGEGTQTLHRVLAACLWEHEEIGSIQSMQEVIAYEKANLARTWQPMNPLIVDSFVAPALQTFENRHKS